MSRHCPHSATCHKKARSSSETISGRYVGLWIMNKISHNSNNQAARKRHFFANTNYGAPLRKIYVTLLTRKTKQYRFLDLVPSQEVLSIHSWCPLSQVRSLSLHLMLSLALRLPSQSHVVPNGKELPRLPSCLHKKLLNFSY